jgi:hypothetical protein
MPGRAASPGVELGDGAREFVMAVDDDDRLSGGPSEANAGDAANADGVADSAPGVDVSTDEVDDLDAMVACWL